MQNLKTLIKQIVAETFGCELEAEVTRPDVQFGDAATNIAMQLAKKVGQNPRDIAQTIVDSLSKNDLVAKASVAGPGFINIRLSDEEVLRLVSVATALPTPLKDKVVVAEYSDPNPFKVLHAGHLYTSTVGDAVANVLLAAGADVHRVNFGGDVGRHVGQTMWAIIQELGGEYPEKLTTISKEERAQWMASAYVRGTAAYEEDEAAKQIIIGYNKRVYELHKNNDHESSFAQIYWTCRQWSYDYFDEFYDRIGTHFEKYYPESSVADLGLTTVKEQLTHGVFKESEGAVVFEGEPHGLHTRVFINKEGLPTYEAKDVGLIMHKKADYNFDISFVITGNEQEQYMAVVLKAIEQFAPELSYATKHVTHGIVKLAGGVKMSSRRGNILRAVDVLDAAAQANMAATGKQDERVSLGAVRYAFLKQRIGGDIIYDPQESVSLQGNSGPYIQYAHARACSILAKSNVSPTQPIDFTQYERALATKVGEFPEVIEKVLVEYMPHHICTYLYELTQVFNRFYENEQVVGSDREAGRLWLLQNYRAVLAKGLDLLSIAAPESM